MKKYVIGLLLILSVIAVGCNRQTVEDAAVAFCDNLQAFDDTLTNLDSINATATVGELKAATAQVDKAWNEVTKSANQLHDVKLDTIDESWKNLRRTVNQINNNDTLAAAAINVAVSVEEIRLSYAQIGEVDCPGFAVGPSAQEQASEAQPSEAATTTEPAAPGFTGTYSATLTLPTFGETTMVLVLNENGTAFIVTRLLDQASESTVLGTWQDNGDGTADVTQEEMLGGEKIATPATIRFRLEGDQLVAVQYDETVYGAGGFSLQRTENTAVAVEAAAVAAQASSGITATTPMTTTAPISASPPLIASAPIIVIPPVPATGPAAPLADSPAAAEQPATALPLDRPWQLQQITQTNGADYTPDDPSLYTVTFNSDGTLNVTADCNTGAGAYQADVRGALTINLSATRAYCPAGSLSNQFISYLSVANAYKVDGDALGIGFSSNNGLMTFTAAP